MNKSTFFTFLLESIVFIVILFFWERVWQLSQESIAFILIVFGFSWFVCYQNIRLLLSYFSHLIMVALLSLIVMCVVALLLSNITHIFLVSVSSIATWFFIILIARGVFLRMNFFKYKFVIHPSLENNLSRSHRAKFISLANVTPNMLKRFNAVIIDDNLEYGEDWNNFILYALRFNVPVITIEVYEEIVIQKLTTQYLNEKWMSVGFYIPFWYRYAKNVFDVVVILILLPVILPILLIGAILVFLTMGMPIFFTQKRVGKNGKDFEIYKFRTMKKSGDNSSMTIDNDIRITQLGMFLRKFRIDEIPQFLNVLKGDMSIIGPRPEQQKFVESFTDNIHLYSLRHLVKPGITGWAQVNQGYANNTETTEIKLQYDLYYIKYFGPVIDIKIILKTIYTVLTGFGSK